jgi:hypothetical protein
LRDPALERSPTKINLLFAPMYRKGSDDPEETTCGIQAIKNTANASQKFKRLGGAVSI